MNTPPTAVAVDFETFYSKKLKYTMTGMVAEEYCKSHLFDPYMISVCDGVHSWSGHPRDFNWAALDGKLWLSHNRYFDNSVYNEMVLRGLAPKVARVDWHCTANLTSYLCNRRSLAEAIEHLFKVKLSKAARSDADGKRWPADFSPEEQRTMLLYAKDDGLWCWKTWDKFSPQWPEHERLLSNFTIDQGMFGVQMNTHLLSQYIIQTHELKSTAEKKLPWLDSSADDEWEGFNAKPTSTKCIAEQCRRSGIPCPPVKAHEGEEAYNEWEAKYAGGHSWIAAMSSWRSINKLLKTFERAKERLRDDNTMPFDLKYFGAHTGRWAGGGKLNFQNFRKVPIFVRASDGVMETDEKRIAEAVKVEKKTGMPPDWVGGHPIDFRRLIIPRPGYKMITSDLSQIEPRVLAWLCGDTRLLDLIRSGYGVYEAFARANFGWTGGELKEEDPDRYQMTKIQVLGLGYGCGWEKFIAIAQESGVDLCKSDPEWVNKENPITGEITKVSGYGHTSRAIVESFRQANPKIRALWKKLDDAFKQSVGTDFVMTLPSGRSLRYEKVRCETRIESDPETGKPRRKSVFTAAVGSKRSTIYGGLLTENLVQATARDVFSVHLLRLQDAGHRVLFTAHDEAICEVSPDISAGDIKRIMSEAPSWISGCPVAAESKEVACYTK